jgi:hypothetical protein
MLDHAAHLVDERSVHCLFSSDLAYDPAHASSVTRPHERRYVHLR